MADLTVTVVFRVNGAYFEFAQTLHQDFCMEDAQAPWTEHEHCSAMYDCSVHATDYLAFCSELAKFDITLPGAYQFARDVHAWVFHNPLV